MAFWALRGLLRGVVTTRYPTRSRRDQWATALPTPPRFVVGRVSPTVASQVVAVCPSHALWLDDDDLVLDLGACTACGACRRAAPHAVRESHVSELATLRRGDLLKRVPLSRSPR